MKKECLQARETGDRFVAAFCRPLRGASDNNAVTQGSASLHPGLYGYACSAGS